MRPLLSTVAKLATAAVTIALLVMWPNPATARMVPETLADRQPVGRGPVDPGFAIDYVGVFWSGGGEHGHEAGSSANGAVRFRSAGTWGPWVPLTEDGVEGRGQWASGLVSGGGAEAYQVRGLPADAQRPRAVAINTTDGPLVEVATSPGDAAHAVDSSRCRSRAEWGADESLRFDSSGNEIFPPTYHDAQVMTVHHTATKNNDPDPEATVRAIYRYHAVDRGWGDIGYQYLIDESGMVYEGRWSGTTSPDCGSGGNGSEFGHEAGGDHVVTGAHTGGWNSGNLGVALLGEFTEGSQGAEPKATAVGSLEDLLAELATRHAMDPLATVTYVNPVSGDTKDVQTISGHRDYKATECPGGRLYDMLPTIRQNVAATMSTSTDPSPTLHVRDLDGSAKTVKNGWRARVTSLVKDGTGTAVGGATVHGTWSTGATASCTTGSSGTCPVTSGTLRKSLSGVTFRIDDVVVSGYTYDGTANSDPDGDSDGTTITVQRP